MEHYPAIEEHLTRLDVVRYLLEVEFSKLPRPPLDVQQTHDPTALIEMVPEYHDGPRNSPKHMYAALLDPDLHWGKAHVPASRMLMGPADDGLPFEYVKKANAFIDEFVRMLNMERDRQEFAEWFWDRPIRYPFVLAVLEEYTDATPYLDSPKKDYGMIYKLKDGYHRAFQTIARGMLSVPVILGYLEGFRPWRGYRKHLS